MRPGPLCESMLVACCIALLPFACTSDSGERAASGGGRVTITREPLAVAEGAALVGRVRNAEAAAPSAGRLLVVINEAPQVVTLAPDGSFQVRGLPTGELRLKAELGEVPGVIVVDDVVDGELLEVSLEPQPEHLAIELTRRAQPALAAERPGSRLEVIGDGVVSNLGAGAYRVHVVVRGSGVTVLGAREGEACEDAHRTIVLGDLVIEGDDVSVYDVAVRGAIIVKGRGVHVFDSCSGAYFDGQGEAAPGG